MLVEAPAQRTLGRAAILRGERAIKAEGETAGPPLCNKPVAG